VTLDEAAPRMTEVVVRDGQRDEVAVEEPLEIRVGDQPMAVTMRTPGHDEELALGFLHGEGLIDSARRVDLTDDLAANIVCARGALEEVAVLAAPAHDGPTVPRGLLATLPDRLRQPAFERTGGLHATGLFDADGTLRCVREDVGRHNAMDKVIGRALIDGLVPLRESVLCVSGRLSYELVQKAALSGAPILVGVGAPSSLAIRLAAEQRMTLGGFARNGTVNVYTDRDRVIADTP
jgi:FdhD protein